MNQLDSINTSFKPLKIVVTGASGNIGSEIVSFLSDQGHELLLTGRNKKKLQAKFGAQANCASNDDWYTRAKQFNVVIDLATHNNFKPGTLKDYRDVNVGRLKELTQEMKIAKISHLIYFSSIHVNESTRMDFYSQSKREAEAWLKSQEQISTTIFRLPAILTENTQGSLRYINRLPAFLKPLGISFAKCLRPMTEPKIVLKRLDKLLRSTPSKMQEIFVSDQQKDNKVYKSIATAIDYTVGLFTAVFLSWWLLLAIWILVKSTSPGPGFFIQDRVGKNRKVFKCYKFRTMKVETVQAGTHEVPEYNITAVGKVLRKTKLDELPQFINLLKNEMSVVGPRPCLPNQQELIEERDKQMVFTIKPGITGLSQIKKIDMSNPKLLAKVDRYYLDTRTTVLDIMIIFGTIFKKVSNKIHNV